MKEPASFMLRKVWLGLLLVVLLAPDFFRMVIGGADTLFAPQDAVTRAQAAVAFKRLLQAASFINGLD